MMPPDDALDRLLDGDGPTADLLRRAAEVDRLAAGEPRPGELDRWRGLLAKRIYLEGNNAIRAFSICMGTAEARVRARGERPERGMTAL